MCLEGVSAGRTPISVLMFVAGASMIDSVNPGDNVEVTGILRAEPPRVGGRRRLAHSVCNTCALLYLK